MKLVFALLSVLLLCGFGEATVFEVGGSSRTIFTWTIPSRKDFYQNWASSTHFTIHDTIHFRYKKDSVFLVSQNDFETCNASNPIISYMGENTYFMFNSFDTYYFISGELGHCELGQKVAIQVASSAAFVPAAPVPSSDLSTVGGPSIHPN